MAGEQAARIKAGVWQGIAQSGVSLSALPPEQVDQLVNGITAAVTSALASAPAGAPAHAAEPAAPDGEEQILWEGSPLLGVGVKYQITTERVRIFEGVLNKARDDIELVRVQDVDHTQSLGERMTNIGDIIVRSHDRANPEVVLRNVTDPEGVHEILRRAVLDARRRHGMTYREEM